MRQALTNYKHFKPGDFVKFRIVVYSNTVWQEAVGEVLEVNHETGSVTVNTEGLHVTLNNFHIILASDKEALAYRLTRSI